MSRELLPELVLLLVVLPPLLRIGTQNVSLRSPQGLIHPSEPRHGGYTESGCYRLISRAYRPPLVEHEMSLGG